jgi:hypothetical protein
MILPWVVAAAALAVAVVAWALARRTARRVEQLSQMYWELKYQHGELRAQLQQLTGETHPPARGSERPASVDAFVPLASLKR